MARPSPARFRPTVYYLIDQSARNWLNLSIEGFDAQFDYRVRHRRAREGAGRHQRHVLHEVRSALRYQPRVLGAEHVRLQRRVPVDPVQGAHQRRSRCRQALRRPVYWNHIGSYQNWGGSTIAPLTRDANGNPNGGGDTVDATNTFDLHLAYKLGFGKHVRRLSLSLDVRNLTDEDPPFFNGNQGGFMGGAWGYDNYTANPVGRLITLGVRTNF